MIQKDLNWGDTWQKKEPQEYMGGDKVEARTKAWTGTKPGLTGNRMKTTIPGVWWGQGGATSGEARGLGRGLEFLPQLCHQLTVFLWIKLLCSSSLSFAIWKMGKRIDLDIVKALSVLWFE